MDIKYTEVPGAALATVMIVCRMATLLVGIASAVL